MNNDRSGIWLIAKRELRDQSRDWRILFPMLILTTFFPFLMNSTARIAVDFVNDYGATMVSARLIPFLMMVVGFFPITVALVVALESFVGEKERGTIEPLLSSPLPDWQIYYGKLIAGVVVPLIGSYLSISIYMGMLYFSDLPLPEPITFVQTIILTGVQGVLMVSGALAISAQATSVRAANLLASFVIIPVALLVQGESVLMFWGDNSTLWLAIFGVAVLAGIMIRLGLAHFQRELLLGREIDVLNVRWLFGIFKSSFMGESRSLTAWYTQEVFPTLRRLRLANLVLVIIGILTIIISFYWAENKIIEFSSLNPEVSTGDLLDKLGNQLDMEGEITFQKLFVNNARAEFFGMLIGLFSFGIFGVFSFILNMGLIGGLFGAVNGLGEFPTWMMFVTGVLPHGIFELPSLLFSSAAVLSFGVKLMTPNPKLTMGQVIIESIANWLKIYLGICLPLLVIAAFIESSITPMLLGSLLESIAK